MGLDQKFQETLNWRKLEKQNAKYGTDLLSPMWNYKGKSVDYNKDLAVEDAKEYLTLIKKTKVYLLK